MPESKPDGTVIPVDLAYVSPEGADPDEQLTFWNDSPCYDAAEKYENAPSGESRKERRAKRGSYAKKS